jgi:hypothetical protein
MHNFNWCYLISEIATNSMAAADGEQMTIDEKTANAAERTGAYLQI